MRIERLGLCVMAAWLWPTAASAMLEPYFVGAGQGFTADNNLYRVPDGQARTRDLVSSSSVFAGFDQPLSRWKLAANASLRSSRYRNETTLDNEGYATQIKLEGATVEHLSGELDYTRSRNLLGFGTATEAAQRLRNLETAQQLVARAQLGLSAGAVSPLSATATLSHRSLDYSAPAYASQQNVQDVAGAGLTWQPGEVLQLGLGLRRTHGRYPQGTQSAPGRFEAESFDRHDIDLTAHWAASGASSLDARLSASRQQYDAARQRDFSGATGALTWNWRPSAKLSLTTAFSRDTGSEASYASLAGSPGVAVGDTGEFRRAVDVQAGYAMTAKLRATAQAQWVQRGLRNESLPAGQAPTVLQGSDRLATLELGVRYTLLRSTAMQCELRRERRLADTPLSYPFQAKTASCELRITLQ